MTEARPTPSPASACCQAATGEKKLGKITANAKQTLLALKVELRDEALEHESPVELDVSSPPNDAGYETATR